MVRSGRLLQGGVQSTSPSYTSFRTWPTARVVGGQEQREGRKGKVRRDA